MTPLDHAIMCVQVLSLLVIIGISICRLNAMGPKSRRTLKVAYITLAGGAFAMLITLDHAHGFVALFSSGTALAFLLDSRKSACYDGECPIP